MSNKSWKINVITHRHIFDRMYAGDPLFSLNHFTFINISGQSLREDYQHKYQVRNIREMPGFIPLGSNYGETEVIYNIFKNRQYCQDSDYIGFLHYDHELVLGNRERNISERITNYLQDKEKAHICFAKYHFKDIYNQNILADWSQPQNLIGPGLNCCDYVLKKYNRFFNTHYTIKNLLKIDSINMCSGFLIDWKTFETMMQFICHLIDSGKLDKLDPMRQNRHQGHIVERCYGIFLQLQFNEFLDLSLPHHYDLKNL